MSGPWELCGGEGGGVAGHHRDGQAAGAEDRAHHGVEGPSSSVPRNLIDAMVIVMHALPLLLVGIIHGNLAAISPYWIKFTTDRSVV